MKGESTSGTPAPVTFQGEVVEVLYRKEGSAWGILKAREAGSAEDRVVTGLIGALAPGNFIEAKGQWVQGRRGKEFKASFIRNDFPAHPAGIIKFLASGVFVGVGEVTAERLVGAFGSETLHVILQDPDRVAKVHGVGLRRAKAMQDALLPMRMEAPVLADLRSIMGEAKAQKAVEIFGGQAANLVKENPFAFAGRIPGFGFKSADEAARVQGLKHDSPQRLQAAALWALEKSEDAGHCALPLPGLEKEVAYLTKVDRKVIERERLDVVMSGRVAVEEADGIRYVYRPKTLAAERRVAAEIMRRIGKPFDISALGQIDQRIARAERSRNVQLDWRQRTGVRQALTSRISIITGFPGTGKSSALAVLVDVLGRDRVTLAAPTGKAARRMSETTGVKASTIHVLLGYHPKDDSFAFDAQVRLPVKFLVIDEASMMDVFIADAVLQALPDDAQLLIMGDVDQLPSVGPGNILADLITSGVLPVTRFETVYRQGSGSAILHNALLVNRGHPPDFSGMSREFRFIEASTAEEAQRIVIEQITHVMPKSGYDVRTQVQTLVAMNKGAIGVDVLNDLIRSTFKPLPGGSLQTSQGEFRMGDKVIQTKNDYNADVYNGDIGYVRGINEKKSRLTVGFEDREVEYTSDLLRNLRLGNAMSIHRSQGSEYEAQILPVAKYNTHMLDRQLLFTGMTRPKCELVLVGPRSLIETAVTTPPRVRHTLLRWRLQRRAA